MALLSSRKILGLLLIGGAVSCANPATAVEARPSSSAFTDAQYAQPASRAPRDVFPPWEGAGIYAFGPLLLDLNRQRERWVPGRLTPLADCSTDQVFCLTARRGRNDGLVAYAGPRRCADFRVGDRWRSGEVRTAVLARIEAPAGPVRDHLDYHGRQRPSVLYYLGDGSNPGVVYGYAGAGGVVAIYLGLTRHPDLVGEVRRGLDPATLPQQHRFALTTLDRFAPCRERESS